MWELLQIYFMRKTFNKVRKAWTPSSRPNTALLENHSCIYLSDMRKRVILFPNVWFGIKLKTFWMWGGIIASSLGENFVHFHWLHKLCWWEGLTVVGLGVEVLVSIIIWAQVMNSMSGKSVGSASLSSGLLD